MASPVTAFEVIVDYRVEELVSREHVPPNRVSDRPVLSTPQADRQLYARHKSSKSARRMAARSTVRL